MITPSYGLTATERVLPRLALDWTTGLAQPGVDVTRAGVATFVGSNGLIQSASVNTQRIDYSTGTAGLLVEESRTNTILYSQDYTNIAWGLFNVLPFGAGSIANATTAPDGSLTANKIVEDTTVNSRHDIYQGVTTTAASWTYSQFLKAGERTWAKLRLDVAGSFKGAYFNLATGEIGTVDAGYTAKIQSFADGWYRCSVTVTATATTFFSSVRMATANGVDIYTGDGVSGLFLGGSQTELGAFATSYIPTEAATVARNADVATMTGTNFSDWYNPTEGTFACEYQVAQYNAVLPQLVLSAGSAAAIEIYMACNTSNVNQFTVVNSTNQANFGSLGSVTLNTPAKICGFYKTNYFSAAGNGTTAGGVDLSGTLPLADKLVLGARNDGARPLNGHIHTLEYWPFTLTTSEILAISKP
jgi:hypothetical protein